MWGGFSRFLSPSIAYSYIRYRLSRGAHCAFVWVTFGRHPVQYHSDFDGTLTTLRCRQRCNVLRLHKLKSVGSRGFSRARRKGFRAITQKPKRAR